MHQWSGEGGEEDANESKAAANCMYTVQNLAIKNRTWRIPNASVPLWKLGQVIWSTVIQMIALMKRIFGRIPNFIMQLP